MTQNKPVNGPYLSARRLGINRPKSDPAFRTGSYAPPNQRYGNVGDEVRTRTVHVRKLESTP